MLCLKNMKTNFKKCGYKSKGNKIAFSKNGYNAPHYKFYFILSLVLLLFSFSVLALKKPVFSLTKEWEASLTALLDSAVQLQNAFYARSDKQVSLSSAKMTYQIKQLEKSSHLLPYHQHLYIQNLLNTLKPRLSAMLKQKNRKTGNIKFISRAVTYMAQVYGLNKYVVFFCPTDRSVWMQKAKKYQYVSHSNFSACKQVRP